MLMLMLSSSHQDSRMLMVPLMRNEGLQHEGNQGLKGTLFGVVIVRWRESETEEIGAADAGLKYKLQLLIQAFI
jgi:hypothetical protein